MLRVPAGSGSATEVSSSNAAASQPVGAPAEGTPTDPPYPTPERVTASEVGSVAAANGVPSSLADAIAWQESGFNNDLVSSADARGVMQILPGTWEWIQHTLDTGGPPLAPASAADNVRGGVLMLHSLLDATGGDSAMAAAGYYQGLPSVDAARRVSLDAELRQQRARARAAVRRRLSRARSPSELAGERGDLRSPAMFYDNDADLHKLDGKTVAIIGYGSQGHAHALNLQDSGVSVVVGLRPDSSSVAKAREHGLRVAEPADAASEGDIVMMLVPDELHRAVWESGVKDGVAPGNMVLFGHGFSIHYGEVVPPPDVDVALVAPKGPGHLVRRQYLEGSGVPGLVAVNQDASGDALALALAYAKGIGCTRGGVIETTFKDETETDLFGEQAVLCGGVTELVRAGYDTLTEAGYDPRLAYFEVLHELKLIVDLIYEKGIAGMRYSISNTAEYGDMTRGKVIIGDATREAMKKVLADIQSGDFAREWIAENRAGQENFKRMREEQGGHQVEVVGRELRANMDWIDTEFQE